MDRRRFFTTVTAGGIALGLLIGFTTNTSMAARPEPEWKHQARLQTPGDSGYLQLVDAGPQDLTPNWEDRMPTWKRRQMQEASYYAPIADAQFGYREEPFRVSEPPAEPASPEPRLARATPLDEAAETRDARLSASASADRIEQATAASDNDRPGQDRPREDQPGQEQEQREAL